MIGSHLVSKLLVGVQGATERGLSKTADSPGAFSNKVFYCKSCDTTGAPTLDKNVRSRPRGGISDIGSSIANTLVRPCHFWKNDQGDWRSADCGRQEPLLAQPIVCSYMSPTFLCDNRCAYQLLASEHANTLMCIFHYQIPLFKPTEISQLSTRMKPVHRPTHLEENA
jgi:hypothetical protein